MPVALIPAVPFVSPQVVLVDDGVTESPPVAVMVVVAVAEQPLRPVTVTVYVPEAKELMVCVVPLLSKTVSGSNSVVMIVLDLKKEMGRK